MIRLFSKAAAPAAVQQEARILCIRKDERLSPAGLVAKVVLPRQPFALRVRNISVGGICGMTDAPLATGETVRVDLYDDLSCEAEVRWVRNTVAGFRFIEPLPGEYLQRIEEEQWDARARLPKSSCG